MKKIETIPTAKEIKNILDDIIKRFELKTCGTRTYEDAMQFEFKYGVKGDIKKLYKIKNSHINDVGIRMQKRLKRYYNRYVIKQSLHSANKLLWLLSKHILELDYSIKIHEPKHEEIQKKRKAWLKLRNEAEIALNEYKKEKGDYYKQKLAQSN